MQYNQPYGVSDPNAPYINGNPSTGTMGSIPPAASIEFPQREIVNFIKDSGLTPDNADLAQLSKSIQSGKIIYGDDAGPASNTIIVTLPRAPDALRKGQELHVKLLHDITGPTVITVNPLASVPAVHGDGSALRIGDGVAGQMLIFLFDGAVFQLLATMSGNLSGIRTKLTGNLTLYIATTGSDTTGDGTSAKPWRTRQFAWYRAQAIYDLVYSYVLTFQMADGTYNDPALDPFTASGVFVGATSPASIIFQGNLANPANCVVNSGAIGWCAQNSAAFRFQGFTTLSSQYGVLATIYGWVSIGPNNIFGACTTSHIASDIAGTVELDASYTINGASQSHYLASTGSFIFCQAPHCVVTLIGTPNFSSAFAICGSSQMSLPGAQLSFSGGATGSRYIAAGCGVIGVNGAGPNFFPGDQVGSVGTGGQYI